ncbi:MAG TPA: hypothetical protein VK914_04880 [bacterium]|nr:hypothetical protein [bacterium]
MSPYFHLTAQAIVASLTPTSPAGSTPTRTASATPTRTPSPTPTFTSGSLALCTTTDHLDLQVSTSTNGLGVSGYDPSQQAYEYPIFKIVNNNASASVNVNNLTIVGWFKSADTGVPGASWGGANYRTWIWNASSGVDTVASNCSSGVAATAVETSGSYGSMQEQVTISFNATGVVIPAGEFMLAGGGNPFSAGVPLFQFSTPGTIFDPGFGNYSNLSSGGVVYTPPSTYTSSYYQNPGWVLYENGDQVCEETAPGVSDPSTGVPATGATCSCPSSGGGATPTPTQTTGSSACATTDQLDLQVSTSTNGLGVSGYDPSQQAYEYPIFKIVNNDPSTAVNVNNLTIVGWFKSADTGVPGASWGGANYRTWIWNASTGVDTVASNCPSGVAATAVETSGSYGSMQEQVTISFNATGVVIPAGEFMLAGGGNPFSAAVPLFQFNTPGTIFDPGFGNYSNLSSGGVVYTPPSAFTSSYYQNPGWVLYENGEQVCEWTDSATKDTSTGVPATGVSCSCASEVPPNNPTATPTPSFTAPSAFSATPSATPSLTMSATPTPTATFTSSLPVCVTTDALDLQVSTSNNGNATVSTYDPSQQAYEYPIFKIVNNSAGAVNVNTLSIKGWFNSNDTGITSGWGGENYRSWIWNAAGVEDSTNCPSGVACTAVLAAGSYGTMGEQITFTFTTSGVALPAGEFLLAGGGNPFGAGTPLFQLSTPGTIFDPGFANYSNLDYGNSGVVYTPPASATSAYYQNPGWVLYENGNQVCEYTSTGADPKTGIPATGATCSCPIPTPTNTPPACAATDSLDLQVSTSNNGNATVSTYDPSQQAYEYPIFKIVNNNATAAVNVNTLVIKGWFNSADTGITSGWGGENYRSWIWNTGGVEDSTNCPSGVACTAVLAAGSYGTMGEQITITFTTSGVALPAGEFLLAGGGNPFGAGVPLFQLSTPGTIFDPGFANYSNLDYGNSGVVYTPPASATSAYYQNPGWVLYENGNQVCEVTGSGADPTTGVPATGATCSCP